KFETGGTALVAQAKRGNLGDVSNLVAQGGTIAPSAFALMAVTRAIAGRKQRSSCLVECLHNRMAVR
ncbi:hypothetical protein, partial [Paraglaciecola sp. 20A4]|uniref:hypothetical protein n=1 Tax=Paraglaciecola sp. 20A4 TaxID=2687288 RepID=UPI001981932E